MDDVALLRQTIRRCTAFLVATIALTGVSVQRASEASLLVIVTVGAVLYLVSEFFPVVPSAKDSKDDSEDG
jgi:p-aminobenzoyl-glutamate transporter AbgT